MPIGVEIDYAVVEVCALRPHHRVEEVFAGQCELVGQRIVNSDPIGCGSTRCGHIEAAISQRRGAGRPDLPTAAKDQSIRHQALAIVMILPSLRPSTVLGSGTRTSLMPAV